MYKNVAKLYNTLTAIYFKEYNYITDEKKVEMDKKYGPNNLFIKDIKYDKWYKIYEERIKSQRAEPIAERVKLRRQKEDGEDLSNMPPLAGNEEVKGEKGLKNLTPNKLLTRLPILLAQIKAGNHSYKLKSEIRQILYLLYQHNKIIKKIDNNLIKSF